MSQIQIPALPPVPDPRNPASPLRSGFNRFSVSIKVGWGDEWVRVLYLEPINCIEAAAPTVGSALFRLRTGMIRREDADASNGGPGFSLQDPRDLMGRYVKIDALADQGPVQWWVGIFTMESFEHMGKRISGQQAIEDGDQYVTAYGLEILLDRKPIITGWVEAQQGDTAPTQIGRAPAFNEQHRFGLAIQGNRSASMLDVPWINDPDTPADALTSAFVFSRDGERWGMGDCMRYLMAFFPPVGPAFILDGQFRDLDNIEIEIPHEGLTHKQFLDRAVDRRRGYGYSVRPGQDGEAVTVHVFSQFEQRVSVGEGEEQMIFEGNPERFSLDIDEKDEVLGCTFTQDFDTQYDRIIVRGRPILTCFTVGIPDGTLEPAWTEDEETAYKAADDAARREERFERVYACFRLPIDFAWRTGDGTGTFPESDLQIANPPIDADGQIIANGVDGDGNDADQPGIWNAFREFSHLLPLEKTVAISQAEPEYLTCPMVFVKNSTGSWFRIESLVNVEEESRHGHAVNLTRESAFRVNFADNHLLALNHFEGATTDIDPEFDFENMIATVAMRTDQCIEVEADLTSAAETGKTLVISMPDAESWFIVGGTVTGIENGEIIRNANEVLRDDSAKLRAVLGVARQWYGKPRRPVSITLQRISAFAKVGWLLERVGSRQVGTVVTRMTYDFVRLTTRIETAYRELDPREFVPVDVRAFGS